MNLTRPLIVFIVILSIFSDCMARYPVDTIRIGLLVQDKKSMAARQGAELAINEANRIEGSGKYYQLKVSDMEGPWGTGARESVSLIFRDDVRAVIGATDGRNSHLAEQVSAKTTVPYITAWSGDPTLGQAFIPWFFSCVPNDIQTADLLIDFIRKKRMTDIVIIARDDYDYKMSASSFQKRYSGEKTEVIYYRDEEDLRKKTGKISGRDCIILFGFSSDLNSLPKNMGSASVIAPYLLMTESQPFPDYQGEIIIMDPGPFVHNSKYPFRLSFLKLYGTNPGLPAAYAYDAVNVVIQGIRQSGNDRASLYRNISKINYRGVTGELSFDSSGNRKVPPGLIKISKGKFLKIED